MWSGDLDSSRGAYPAERELTYAEQIRVITDTDDFDKKLELYLKNNNLKWVVPYGITPVTSALIRQIEINKTIDIPAVLDKYSKVEKVRDISIYNPLDFLENDKEGLIVITVFGREEEIKKDLERMGKKGKMIKTQELLQELGCCNHCGC